MTDDLRGIDPHCVCNRCSEWAGNGECRCVAVEREHVAQQWVELECGHRKLTDASIATWPKYCLTCGVMSPPKAEVKRGRRAA